MAESTTETQSRFDPQIVYDAYPDSDLLGCGPPEAGEESTEEYLDRATTDAGDRLFVFLLHEICGEELTPTERANRLDRARADVEAVAAAVARADAV